MGMFLKKNTLILLKSFRDFTTDPVNYPEAQLKSWVDSLHSNNQKYILIIDPGIKFDINYFTFVRGLDYNIYIKNKDDNPLLGSVWPGSVYFPDFFHPNITQYWFEQMQSFHNKIGFDGIWLDMNELANFCDGECKGSSKKIITSKLRNLETSNLGNLKTSNFGNINPFQSETPDFDNPPYKPLNGGKPLNTHTIELSSKQYISRVYNVHNLYGWSQAKISKQIVDKIYNKRSFILTRSTFSGSGKYTSHWLGDNESTWADLQLSIPGLITMSLFGIPMAGSDICGFNGNTNKELCIRWIELGAFYPFSRNHNAVGNIDQEPYVFGDDVIKITTRVILIKYSLLPFYYTLLYHSHLQGDPVIRGLFYEFPQDLASHSIDVQMLVGPSLLISPVLLENARLVNAYFPPALWYDFFTASLIDTTKAGHIIQLETPLDTIHVHIRGGSIVPKQTPQMTIAATRTSPFQLVAALDPSGSAFGDLFIDDGESFLSSSTPFTFLTFNISNNTLSINILNSTYKSAPPISSLDVWGILNPIKNVIVNDSVWPSSNWSFSKTALNIHELNLSTLNNAKIQWTF